MADDAAHWLTEAVDKWCATQRSRTDGAPYRILSLGCGDGSLDVAVIAAARHHGPVQYVGCDINRNSLDAFARTWAARPVDALVSFELLESSLGETSSREGFTAFDLVLLAHVLYYVPDPAAMVVATMDRHAALDGRTVVIHSARNGVPAIAEAALGTTPFVTAEDLVDDLARHGVTAPLLTLPGRLCIDEIRARSERGDELLRFLVERDNLTAEQHDSLVSAMNAAAAPVAGSWWMPEDLGVIEIRTRLRTASWARSTERVDPLQDYHVLAESFDWVKRLRLLAAPEGEPPRVLDVGCGTGRWLRVLAATHPELTSAVTPRVRYDRIDPSPSALPTNEAIATSLFDLGATWVEPVESAELPASVYGLIWSVHSLYSVSVDALPAVVRGLARALHPDGVIVVALAASDSFYITARPALTGEPAFTCAEDVVAAAVTAGLTVQTFDVGYVETFDLADEEAVRHFVWHESIGNSYAPAGMSSNDLPPLPTGDWWDTHRRGDRYEFPQKTTVIVIGRPPL